MRSWLSRFQPLRDGKIHVFIEKKGMWPELSHEDVQIPYSLVVGVLDASRQLFQELESYDHVELVYSDMNSLILSSHMMGILLF